MTEELKQPTGARKKVERGISALLKGAVSMGYVLDALDALEAEVAERERERCAKIADMQAIGTGSENVDWEEGGRAASEEIAASIRRGK